MDSTLTIIKPNILSALPVFPLGRDQYIALAAEWFSLDVSNGDACADTITTYMSHMNQWLTWCQVNRVDPGRSTVDSVKMFRRELIESSLSHSTIALKLTTIRRFYDGALQRGLVDSNPAKGVRPPKNRAAAEESLLHLETEEANRLFKTIPHDSSLKSLRDRAMISMMNIGGLRRVEVVRSNVDDIKFKNVKDDASGETRRRMRLLIHGKGKDRYKYIRDDVASCIENYLKARRERGPAKIDEFGEPLFTALSKSDKPLARITRDGLTRVLNGYLVASGLRIKLPPPSEGERRGRQLSCHALRHTYGAELWREHHDLKIVQEELGHSTVEMAARYSHVDSKSKDRFADKIAININGADDV